MKPVRIISPGMSPTLPLRMVAAGTGANVDITLFVIGEGRWAPQNFPTGIVEPRFLSWDFKTSSSNYALRRKELLATEGGRTWNEAYSIKGALLSPRNNPINGEPIVYQIDEQSGALTIADTYILQGIKNGEGTDSSCTQAFQSFQQSLDQVVDLCGSEGGSGGGGSTGTGTSTATGSGAGGAGGNGGAGGSGGAGGNGTSTSSGGGAGGGQPVCSAPAPGQIDARVFACGPLDDVAVALQGLHPKDVTITRLESSLPRAALSTDLVLQASASQEDVSNWFRVTASENEPACPSAMVPVIGGDSGKGPWNRNRWALFASVLALILAPFGRRAARPSMVLSRAAR